jgi:hypothetical protein
MSNGHTIDATERQRLDRVYNDVYFGNGKPGLVTRMQLSEERQDAVDARCDKADKSVADTRKMLWAIIILLLSILGSTLADNFKSHDEPRTTIHSFNE